MDDREKEIQILCASIVNTSPNRYYNSNGPDGSSCPFCYEGGHIEAEMEDITHSTDCAYLIAKDLSTNLTPQKQTNEV